MLAFVFASVFGTKSDIYDDQVFGTATLSISAEPSDFIPGRVRGNTTLILPKDFPPVEYSNAVLITPVGKTYNNRAEQPFEPEIIFSGAYDESRPIEAKAMATGETFIDAGLYDAELIAETDYDYVIFVAPYEIKKASLKITAHDKEIRYGRIPSFGYDDYDVYGFAGDDNISVVDGFGTIVMTVPGGRLKRGAHVIEIKGGLSAQNYGFIFENAVLTVRGLYPYEYAFIFTGAAVFFAFAAHIVYLVTVKKKTLRDFARAIKQLFIKEKTVVVIKEVPVSGARHLPMENFTAREQEVAGLLLYGKSRGEIAEALFVSENTVKTHAQNIFSKCGVRSQKALIAKYMLGKGEDSDDSGGGRVDK